MGERSERVTMVSKSLHVRIGLSELIRRVRPGEAGSRIRLTEEKNSSWAYNHHHRQWSLNACLGRIYPSGKDYPSKRSARVQRVHSNVGSSFLHI